mmetsp:Transcript_10311/g.23116  ORF Transcript_10311/g.23116 Transcript_10311/m.23116 type:complete len:91 (-) Transcript_10311:358-630(-)
MFREPAKVKLQILNAVASHLLKKISQSRFICASIWEHKFINAKLLPMLIMQGEPPTLSVVIVSPAKHSDRGSSSTESRDQTDEVKLVDGT